MLQLYLNCSSLEIPKMLSALELAMSLQYESLHYGFVLLVVSYTQIDSISLIRVIGNLHWSNKTKPVHMSSVIESAVVTASKQQSDLIRTALQSFMDLLEGTSPAFFLSGLGCGIAIVSQYCINREQKNNTWHWSWQQFVYIFLKIAPANGRNTNKDIFPGTV